jgi:hypothetical protein
MKKLFLIFTLLLICFAANSQSNKIKWQGSVQADGFYTRNPFAQIGTSFIPYSHAYIDSVLAKRIIINDHASSTVKLIYADEIGMYDTIPLDTLANLLNITESDSSKWALNGPKLYRKPGLTNVGIGTSDPDELLHVAGNIEIDSGFSFRQDNLNLIRLAETNMLAGSQNSTITGVANTFMGHYAGRVNTTGEGNVMLGCNTGRNNEDGTGNVAIGYNAFYNNISGDLNVAIGDRAMYNGEGSYNVAIGNNALYNTQEDKNTAVGVDAMQANTTGDDNVALGYRSLYKDTTGSKNVALGYSALAGHSYGDDNVAVGYQAGMADTLGDRNIHIGSQAGRDVKLDDIISIGYQAAMYQNGQQSVIIGNNAGKANKFQGSVVIGQDAASNETSDVWSAYNVYIGYESGKNDSSCGNNVFVGANTAYNNKHGDNNTFIGSGAGQGSINGNENVCLGDYAGFQLQGGSRNVFLGHEAGYDEQGDDRLYITNDRVDSSASLIWGNFADNILAFNGKVGIGTTDPDEELYVDGNIELAALGKIIFNDTSVLVKVGTNVAVTSTLDNVTGDNNLSLGYGAGESITSGDDNLSIGTFAGRNQTSVSGNVFIGTYTGIDNVFGQNNVAIGKNALQYHYAGANNTAIGTQAMQGSSGNYTRHGNTIIGRQSGQSLTDGNHYNVFIGYMAGANETTSNKLFIENSNSSSPLIYGDFYNDSVKINGTLTGTAAVTTNGFINNDGIIKDGEVHNLADDASVQIEIYPSSNNILEVWVDDTGYDEYALFLIYANGTVTILASNGSVTNSDSDVNLCVYNSSGDVYLKNRLGSELNINAILKY